MGSVVPLAGRDTDFHEGEIDMKEVKGKHDELCNTAIVWLHARGCQAFAQEVVTWNGIADALGIKGDDVYYIEAKASRADLICKKQRGIDAWIQRSKQVEAMGDNPRAHWFRNDVDFFYFIIADGVKFEDTLYPDWGIINEHGAVIRRAKRQKKFAGIGVEKLLRAIAHALVYKVYGRLYLPQPHVVRMPDGQLVTL